MNPDRSCYFTSTKVGISRQNSAVSPFPWFSFSLLHLPQVLQPLRDDYRPVRPLRILIPLSWFRMVVPLAAQGGVRRRILCANRDRAMEMALDGLVRRVKPTPAVAKRRSVQSEKQGKRLHGRHRSISPDSVERLKNILGESLVVFMQECSSSNIVLSASRVNIYVLRFPRSFSRFFGSIGISFSVVKNHRIISHQNAYSYPHHHCATSILIYRPHGSCRLFSQC